MGAVNAQGRLALLEHLLNSDLKVLRVAGGEFHHPAAFPAVIVPSARLIVLLEGAMHYTVEAVSIEMEAPRVLLVPAWVQREWRLHPGARCLLRWCEFSPRFFDPSFRDLLWVKDANWKLESQALKRMMKWWATPEAAEGIALRLQGELKAVLARFLTGEVHASPGEVGPEAGDSPWEGEVRQGIEWINRNFHRCDALSALARSGTFARPPFRREFLRRTGLSSAAYLHLLRMRYARFLLQDSADSIKEISAAVGFNDPLYFSRRYRSFWGHSPKKERP